MREVNAVQVGPDGLQLSNREVLLDDRVRDRWRARVVFGVHLRAQHRSLESSIGFAQVKGPQPRRQCGLAQGRQSLIARPVFACVLTADGFRGFEGAGMEPRASEHRRIPRGLVPVEPRTLWKSDVSTEFLRIPLLDHPEATPLTLESVEGAFVIRVSGDETAATDPVQGLDALGDMNDVGEAGHPWVAGELVSKVKPARWRVADACLGAQVI